MADYKALLVKYMDHVTEVEGTTFLYNIGNSDVEFSTHEVAVLRAIEAEAADALSTRLERRKQ